MLVYFYIFHNETRPILFSNHVQIYLRTLYKPQNNPQIFLEGLRQPSYAMNIFTRCLIEVFEMIVGSINFVGLPYFLQTSKAIRVIISLDSSKIRRFLSYMDGWELQASLNLRENFRFYFIVIWLLWLRKP